MRVWKNAILDTAVLVIMAGMFASACAGNKAPIFVAQSGLAVAQSIGAIQDSVKKLTDAKVLTPEQALPVQERLLKLNDRVKPLPDLLRTIDNLQQAGSSTTDQVDRAIALLKVVGQDLSVTIGGVPVAQTTQPLIDLILAAQETVMTTLAEVARVREEN